MVNASMDDILIKNKLRFREHESDAHNSGTPAYGRDDLIGTWRVHEYLGRNSVGELYLASSELPGPTPDAPQHFMAAVRVFDASLARNPRLVKRFLQEAEKLATIDHPNIASVIGTGRTANGNPFFVREYVEGTTLNALTSEGPLEFQWTIKILLAVCDALDEAEKQGLLHRNLNPSNIIIDTSGNVKVIDFGLSKGVPLEGSDTLGMTNFQMQLDLSYASPEQISGRRLDIKSDLYSLGCIAFLLFTGRELYASTAGHKVLNKKLLHAPDLEDCAELNYAGSEKERQAAIAGVQTLIRKLVSLNANARYASVSALRSELVRLSIDRSVISQAKRKKALPIKTHLAHYVAGAILGIVLIPRLPSWMHSLNLLPQQTRSGIVSPTLSINSFGFRQEEPETTQFSYADLEKILPGTWDYTWSGKGKMRIDRLVHIDKLRAFMGLIEMNGTVTPMSGRISVYHDGVFLGVSHENGMGCIFNGSLLKREKRNGTDSAVFKKLFQPNGFDAAKSEPGTTSTAIENYYLDDKVLQGLTGVWHQLKSVRGTPQRFYVKPIGRQGLFELHEVNDFAPDKCGQRVIGMLTAKQNGMLCIEYQEDWTIAFYYHLGGKHLMAQRQNLFTIDHDQPSAERE
jgi:serine/threonine protein kinase